MKHACRAAATPPAPADAEDSDITQVFQSLRIVPEDCFRKVEVRQFFALGTWRSGVLTTDSITVARTKWGLPKIGGPKIDPNILWSLL